MNAGTYHGDLRFTQTGGASAGTDLPAEYFFKFTVTQTQQATSISSVSGSGTYGGTASLTATLKAGTTPLSGKSISFTINGSAAGTATTDASGVATVSGASLGGINAGTGTVGASFAGDSGFSASSGSGSLTVAKASSTTAVSCPASVTYDGSAKTPCSASATGAGGLNQALTVTYSNNTAAGTATASASYAGDANHNGSSDSKTFTIAGASSTTTVSCPGTSIPYDGSAKKVLELAFREALRLGHNYVDTEHVLLALLEHQHGDSVLHHLGLDKDSVDAEVRAALARVTGSAS